MNMVIRMAEKNNDKVGSWDSDIVILKPTIILGQGVQDVVVSVQREFSKYEFSILFKGLTKTLNNRGNQRFNEDPCFFKKGIEKG